jgi:hypothetical protein
VSGNVQNTRLEFHILTDPRHGLLEGEPKATSSNSAKIVYKPNIDYNGTDNFTFRVNNGNQTSNLGTVSINIKFVPHSVSFWSAVVTFISSAFFVLVIVLVAKWMIRKFRKHIKADNNANDGPSIPKSRSLPDIIAGFTNIIRDESLYPSLAIFQFFVWTLVISFAFFGIYLIRFIGGVPILSGTFIPNNLLILMGISAAVPVANAAASQIKYGAKKAPKVLPPFSSMLMEGGKPTLARFQTFAWTWITIAIYMIFLFSQTFSRLDIVEQLSVPDINPVFLALMAISQGAYVTNKISTGDVLSITEVIPATGKKGEPITILGTNFGTDQKDAAVFFEPINHDSKNITVDKIESWSDKKIIITVPEKIEPKTYNIRVEKGGSSPTDTSTTTEFTVEKE